MNIYTKQELVKMGLEKITEKELEAWKYYKQIQAVMEYLKLEE